MKKTASFLVSFLIVLIGQRAVFAQNLAGIVNFYASATAFDTCSGRLAVSAPLGFETGQSVLIYQPQGATINTANSSSFGNISALNSAGLFEVNEITAVGPDFLTLKYRLENAYDWATGKVQAIASPKIAAGKVIDTVFARKWDGTRGGVVFLKGRKIELEKPVSASGAGFRGGVSVSVAGNDCYFLIAQDDFSYDSDNWRGAAKGEGVAVFSSGKEAGKGAQANGGGGGNDHNSGGGGGSNAKKGGDGGKNAEPETFNCNGDHPGVGGKPLVFTGKERLFMGGGGGAGHGNNDLGGNGGAGGGIVVIVADTLAGAAAKIFSDGGAGQKGTGDGAGGGGAGGSIFLFVQKNLATFSARANGGKGGDQDVLNTPRCFGPGGGGSSGRVVANFSATSTLVGGAAGKVSNSTAGCDGSSNGAQTGEAGSFEQLGPLENVPGAVRQAGPPMLMAQPKSLTVCVGEPIQFVTSAMGGDLVFEWELNSQGGWQAILDGNANFSGPKTPVLNVASTAFPVGGTFEFRCKITSKNGCGHAPVFTDVAKLQIFEQPTVDFSSLSQSNLTVVFQNLGQNLTGQTWAFGDGTTSQQANPSHQYSTAGPFTVTLTGWNQCDTITVTKTVTTDAAPVAFFEVADSVFGCGNSIQVPFENLTDVAGGQYQWSFPGGQPSASTAENPIITYSSSGIYAVSLTATNGAGSSGFQRTFKVFFQQSPVANFQVTNVSGYKVSILNLSQGGDSYQWDFGDGTTFSGFQPPNPHIFPSGGPRVITLVVQNACGASIFQYEIDLAYTSTDDFLAEKWGLRISPNPTDGLALAAFEKGPSEPLFFQVFDATGRLIFEKWDAEKTVEIDLTGAAAGLYFLKIRGEEGAVLRRLLKN